ncbi:uncharacterized protein SRS1_11806 [Sporisorium reilianum f. sp. reilianum]|uniref:Transmembrane protein n=1 Tax=Sporisorium reilianum f. sp. reilianum TaxID=72559 RepID=A0A2N8U669_9BASI|nr:uncharacterized protein SRS1_11806 [Sporisorium reilianum f. sp. reilianum]
MPIPNTTTLTFVGLNLLRLISLITILLVLTTLIMGLVEDVRDYHDDTLLTAAEADDCAYVPGTSIPMQTWGIFWVELHRALMMLGVIALALAELSWVGIGRLEVLAQAWMPVLSRTRGLAALGGVEVVVATSMLSHYLDEFPLVVSWMLFVVGMCYVCLGLAFHDRQLKDARSLFAERRKQFGKSQAPAHTYRSLKDYGATTTSKPTATLRKLFKRKPRTQTVSIHDTFPTLEPASHKQVLAAKRAQHTRNPSSVAVDMSHVDADRASLTRDFIYNTHTGIVHERDSQWNTHRRDSEASHRSCSDASIASSTVRIGGYASHEAARARERRRRRGHPDRSHPPPAKSSSAFKSAKRRSVALVTTARNRLSAGTASALAARRRNSPLQARGIPNADTQITVEYVEDSASAPPVPPLPAYHQAMRDAEAEELPVASRFARAGHVV